MTTAEETLDLIGILACYVGVIAALFISGCVCSSMTQYHFRTEAYKRGFMEKVVDFEGKETYVWKQSDKQAEQNNAIIK